MYFAQINRLVRRSACFVLLVLLGSPAWAAQVDNLYSAQVEPGTPAERRVENALAQVLVKVSGHRDIMQRPEVQTVLDNANLLQQAQPDAQRIGFDPAGLTSLMHSLELPVQPDDRPEMLVWIAREQAATAELVEPGGEIFRQLAVALQQRGLPLRQPLLDLTDQLALTAVDLFSSDSAALFKASARYQADAILAGVQSEGSIRWRLLYDGQTLEAQSTADAADLHRLADRLANRLFGIDDGQLDATSAPTLTPEPVDLFQPEGITLQIEGIATPAAYLDITGWLRQQPGVQQLFTVGQEGQRLKLIVQIEGGATMLQQVLSQNPRLMPEGELQYRWIDI